MARPYAAHTKKGKLRARMARELLAAHQAGRVQVAIGRASEPFIVDSSKIAAKLGVDATPMDQALADTVASYRATTS